MRECERTERWEIVLRTDVGNVECAMLADPAITADSSILISTRPSRIGNQNEPARPWRSLSTKSQHHVINPTNPRRALDDGVEDRLHVRGRAADDPEHFGRRRLMLHGAIRVEFLEQTRTFSIAITA